MGKNRKMEAELLAMGVVSKHVGEEIHDPELVDVSDDLITAVKRRRK